MSNPKSQDIPLFSRIKQNMHDQRMLGNTSFSQPSCTRIVAVTNQKGGVGKTTTAVNLAATLTLGGLSIVAVDTDARGSASSAFSIKHYAGTPSTYDVLIGGAALAGVLQECPDIEGLRVCPATIDLSGAETELVDLPRHESRLTETMKGFLSVTRDVDVAIVDCPPSLGLVTLNVMVSADEVPVPIQTEYYALEDLSQLWNAIRRIRSELNPKLHVSTMFLTMFNQRACLSEEVEAEVRAHFSALTLNTIIPRSIRISEAPNFDQLVVTYRPRNIGALAYRKAALELSPRFAQD